MVSKISVVCSGLHFSTSEALSHWGILIKLQSHTGHRVMPSLLFYWDKLLYHRPHTLGPILKLPCSASAKGIEPQSYTIFTLKSVILTPLIIPAGLPVPLRDCNEQLSKERMFQAQAPGAQFPPEQLVKVNLVTVALSELSSFLPGAGKVLPSIVFLCKDSVQGKERNSSLIWFI